MPRPFHGRFVREGGTAKRSGSRPQSLSSARARRRRCFAYRYDTSRSDRRCISEQSQGQPRPPKGAGTLSAAKSRRTPKEQVTLEFPDNALLAGLAGAHQKNFVRLEQKLDVRIAMRGNLVAIKGAPDKRERAATVMRALYARLEGGEACSSSEVDAEVRFAGERAAAPVGASFGSPSIRTASSRVTRARSPAQAAHLDLMRTHPLVFGIGPAGTGKTYLAAAFGAHLLHERQVERIVLTRPALEAGERLGFLPGDLREKIDPYLRPLYDALFDVLGDKTLRLVEQGVIEIAPLAFMRGRTLSRAFVILD